MKTVSAREANQRFSKILAEAENGEEVTITRYGRAVAQMLPLTRSERNEAERIEAHKSLMKLLRKGLHLGGRKFTRDEMHER